jgi:hypothetical protein
MIMDLFSMGVVDDDDRPKQHKPAPVRCLEDELLPPVPRARRCVQCHNHAMPKGDKCNVCARKIQLEKKVRPPQTQSNQSRSFKRLRTAAICNGGLIVETRANSRYLADFVDAGNARWATVRDLNRLGEELLEAALAKIEGTKP